MRFEFFIFQRVAISIFTRPISLCGLKPRHTLIIFTTPDIKSIIAKSNEKLQVNIITDTDGYPVKIPLPGNDCVIVRAFSYGSSTLSVVLILERNCLLFTFSQYSVRHKSKCFSHFYLDQKRFQLWAGGFRANFYEDLMQHSFLAKLIRNNKIYTLHLDTTNIELSEITDWQKDAFNKICQLYA